MSPDEWVMISALEHWSYCPRQCGLIHLESTFDENLFTLKGGALHTRIDEPGYHRRKGVRVERALPLWSDRLGLYGKADAVEFDREDHPHPVEYKSGKPVNIVHASIQLCAQTLCLEDMLEVRIERGTLFYGGIKQRVEVSLDQALRDKTFAVIEAVRMMQKEERLALPVNDRRCRHCSLIDACQPFAVMQGIQTKRKIDKPMGLKNLP